MNLTSSFHAAAGHRHIEHNEVGFVLTRDADRIIGAAPLCDDFEISFFRKRFRNAFSDLGHDARSYRRNMVPGIADAMFGRVGRVFRGYG